MRTSVLVALLVACGGAPAPAPTASAVPPPAPPAPQVFFALSLDVDAVDAPVVYVVLDETRGAGAAATSEPADLSEGTDMRVTARSVDAAAVGWADTPEIVAVGADCRGRLGAVVELTLRDLHDEPSHEILGTVLAAPLVGACAGEPVLAYVAGTPAPQSFEIEADAAPDAATRDEAAAILRTLPDDAELQRLFDDMMGDEPHGRWDADAETSFSVLRDAGGRELVSILVEGGGCSQAALFERVNGALVVRATSADQGVTTAGFGSVVDLEGDGPIELVERTGIFRDGALVRRFERAPFEPGC